MTEVMKLRKRAAHEVSGRASPQQSLSKQVEEFNRSQALLGHLRCRRGWRGIAKATVAKLERYANGVIFQSPGFRDEVAIPWVTTRDGKGILKGFYNPRINATASVGAKGCITPLE